MANSQQLRVFVSHSYQDNDFCERIVQALRAAGADVWYDEHNMESGQLMTVIQRELGSRPIFVLILSKAAFASKWVKRETMWAYEMADRDPARVILPVTASPIERADFDPTNGWLFLFDFKRIEAPGYQPHPVPEAAQRLLHALALSSANGATPSDAPAAHGAPQPPETLTLDDLLTRGRALNAQQKYDEALPLFESATAMDPASFDAWFNLGYTCEQLEDHEAALAALERALDLDPSSNAASYNMGNALYKLGRYEEALAAYDRNFDEHDARDANGKGNALIGLQRYEEALEAYNQALALDPNYALSWFNKGVALHNLGRNDEALAAYEQAAANDPNDKDVWNNKGIVLRVLGRPEEALADYNHALRLDPDNAATWFNKGVVLEDLKRYAEALAAYERGFDPNDPRDWRGKARCLRALGRTAEANDAEQRAKELDERQG